MREPGLSLTPPLTPLSRNLLDSKGGFVWWYLDAVDPAGDGLVLIWSFGLPFLPGYRATPDALPRNWPSLNVAVYEGGKPSFYLLQRYAPHEAEWDDGDWANSRWRFGDTEIRRTVGDQLEIRADLNAPLPNGGRLTGTIELAGVRRAGGAEAAGGVQHDWSPLSGPCRVQADLRAGAWSARVDARGYHDRNGGKVGLWDLGMSHWLWGRAPFEDEDRIYYVIYPDAGPPKGVGLINRADGSSESMPVELEEQPGLSSWTGAALPKLVIRSEDGIFAEVQPLHLVDHGPFYGRAITEVRANQRAVRGVSEVVYPGRVDLPWQRIFVKQRVHDTNAAGKPLLLDWFTGPHRGRLKRFLTRGAA